MASVLLDQAEGKESTRAREAGLAKGRGRTARSSLHIAGLGSRGT